MSRYNGRGHTILRTALSALILLAAVVVSVFFHSRSLVVYALLVVAWLVAAFCPRGPYP